MDDDTPTAVPAITVLMPVRNGATFISAAVHSVLCQSFTNLELLAVDDGSVDATPRILVKHAITDHRIRIITTEPLGVVSALNRGLAEARAPIIARMDADDVAAPERLTLQHAALERDPGLALVASGWRIINPTGLVRRVVQPPTDPAALLAELQQRNCIAHASVMFRRRAVQETGGYRAAFALAEDYDLWRRLSERHRLLALPQFLLDHREHPGQSSLGALEKRILAELGVHAAAARRALAGADSLDNAEPINRAMLLELGMDHHAVQVGILARALGAAEDALAAGHPLAARAAIALAHQQGGLARRTRLHLAALSLRAKW